MPYTRHSKDARRWYSHDVPATPKQELPAAVLDLSYDAGGFNRPKGIYVRLSEVTLERTGTGFVAEGFWIGAGRPALVVQLAPLARKNTKLLEHMAARLEAADAHAIAGAWLADPARGRELLLQAVKA